MCGIAGFLLTNAKLLDAEHVVRAMTQALRHRGPDAEGVWHDGPVALGHRRLSVVDLSAAGAQPMVSSSGRFILTFNGEIYNHRELRLELESDGWQVAWRGQSDTETLLAAIEHWGMAPALRRTIGMFALALWDCERRELILARDRMGEKPLYLARTRGAILFASELKALHAFPNFAPALNRTAIGLYTWFSYVPAPHTIYEGVSKHAPGTILFVDAAGKERCEVYWSLDTALSAPRWRAEPQEAAMEVEALLRDAVRHQLAADVPVGAFLSGGVDSSTVAALMREVAPRQIRTFSVGFADPAFDERPYARAVAQHLETDHSEILVSEHDARELLPILPRVWDEPFADSSQIPTLLLARLARQSVTVCLTGDGGDELFCGYHTHRPAIARIPTAAAAVLRHLPLRPFLDHRLSLIDPDQRHLATLTQWSGEASLVLGDQGHPTDIAPAMLAGMELSTRLAAIDAKTYLPDDLLVKVDRAAMNASLETRMPMLDHRLVELAFRLPDAIKYHGGYSKWPLRQILASRLPARTINPYKQGFSVPLAAWLRGPLRDWADDMLSATRLKNAGMLDVSRVAKLWQAHRNSDADHATRLWNIVMFEAWRETRLE